MSEPKTSLAGGPHPDVERGMDGPLRITLSWPPPLICGSTRTLKWRQITGRANILSDMSPIPIPIFSTSMGILRRVWAAWVWKKTSFSRQMPPDHIQWLDDADLVVDGDKRDRAGVRANGMAAASWPRSTRLTRRTGRQVTS